MLIAELDVPTCIIAQVPVINALVFSNLSEHLHKSYIFKTRLFGL